MGAELALPALRLTVGGQSQVLDAQGVTPLDDLPAAFALTLVAGSAAHAGPDSVLVPASAARALGLTPAALVGRADIMDLALAGKTATVESIEQDVEGRIYLAVTVDDDPGKDLGALRQPGHRFFFQPDEVESLP